MDYRGWWSDGKSARRDGVRVRPFGHCLVITDAETGRHVAELSLDGLRLAEEIYAGQPVRLKHDRYPDARLTVDDHALMDALTSAAPHLGRRYHARHGTLYRVALWSGALVATVALLLGIVQFGAEPLAAVVPLEWEQKLGERTMADFVDHYGACDVSSGAEHLQALVEEIAAQAESPYRFRVQILESEQVNAFVLPGGYIAVFDGLVQRADGPDELAGVLAHEVAHGVERHATEQLLRRSGYSLLASLVTGDMSGFAVLAGDALRFFANTANSRADEAEADRVAMRLLNETGIDSHGLPRFFAELEGSDGADAAVLALVSTHPAHEARIRETRALARDGRAALDDRQWAAVRSACEAGAAG